jgi:hypothetical protein
MTYLLVVVILSLISIFKAFINGKDFLRFSIIFGPDRFVNSAIPLIRGFLAVVDPIYVCVHIYILYRYTYMYIYTYVYTQSLTKIHMHIYLCIFEYICMRLYLSIYVCMYTKVCIKNIFLYPLFYSSRR